MDKKMTESTATDFTQPLRFEGSINNEKFADLWKNWQETLKTTGRLQSDTQQEKFIEYALLSAEKGPIHTSFYLLAALYNNAIENSEDEYYFLKRALEEPEDIKPYISIIIDRALELTRNSIASGSYIDIADVGEWIDMIKAYEAKPRSSFLYAYEIAECYVQQNDEDFKEKEEGKFLSSVAMGLFEKQLEDESREPSAEEQRHLASIYFEIAEYEADEESEDIAPLYAEAFDYTVAAYTANPEPLGEIYEQITAYKKLGFDLLDRLESSGVELAVSYDLLRTLIADNSSDEEMIDALDKILGICPEEYIFMEKRILKEEEMREQGSALTLTHGFLEKMPLSEQLWKEFMERSLELNGINTDLKKEAFTGRIAPLYITDEITDYDSTKNPDSHDYLCQLRLIDAYPQREMIENGQNAVTMIGQTYKSIFGDENGNCRYTEEEHGNISHFLLTAFANWPFTTELAKKFLSIEIDWHHAAQEEKEEVSDILDNPIINNIYYHLRILTARHDEGDTEYLHDDIEYELSNRHNVVLSPYNDLLERMQITLLLGRIDKCTQQTQKVQDEFPFAVPTLTVMDELVAAKLHRAEKTLAYYKEEIGSYSDFIPSSSLGGKDWLALLDAALDYESALEYSEIFIGDDQLINAAVNAFFEITIHNEHLHNNDAGAFKKIQDVLEKAGPYISEQVHQKIEFLDLNLADNCQEITQDINIDKKLNDIYCELQELGVESEEAQRTIEAFTTDMVIFVDADVVFADKDPSDYLDNTDTSTKQIIAAMGAIASRIITDNDPLFTPTKERLKQIEEASENIFGALFFEFDCSGKHCFDLLPHMNAQIFRQR